MTSGGTPSKIFRPAVGVLGAGYTSDFMCDLYANCNAISLCNFVFAVASTERT
jgi:hypothetical protein